MKPAPRVPRRSAPRILGGALALLLAACTHPVEGPPAPRPVMAQQARLVGSADLAVYAGEVRPRWETELGFRIAGKLDSRLVDVGAPVKRGQVLARLDGADLGLARSAAEAQVNALASEAALAGSELARYGALLERKGVSQSLVDQKRAAAEAAQARLKQAQAQRDVTGRQASYASLAADHDGVVTAVLSEPGQVLGVGQGVLRVARLDALEVVIQVPESRVAELQGAPLIAVSLRADPERRVPGRLRELSPSADPITRTFTARIAVDPQSLPVRLGMSATVVLQGAASTQTMLLPLSALYQRGSRPAVWVVDPPTARVALRDVDVRRYREDGVEIAAGLRPGEWVVTAGVHKLHAGEVVRLPAEAQSPGAHPAAPS